MINTSNFVTTVLCQGNSSIHEDSGVQNSLKIPCNIKLLKDCSRIINRESKNKYGMRHKKQWQYDTEEI